MNFLALSHAPPPLFISMASRMPLIVPTISSAGDGFGAAQVDWDAVDHWHSCAVLAG